MAFTQFPRNYSAEAKNVFPNRFNEPQLDFMEELASQVFVAAPLDEVLARVLDFITSTVRCDSCFLYVLEDGALVMQASKNPHPEAVDRLTLKVGQGITGWVAENRTLVVLEKNAWKDPRFRLFNDLPEDRFESFLSVPVMSRGQVVGVINLQDRAPHRYDDSEIKLISSVGMLVGAEVEIARLENENSHLSKKLETRILVERAKGILQRELGINEEEAYQAMQKESQQRRKSMKDISEAILLSDDMKRKLK